MKAHYESFETKFGTQHRIIISGGSSGQYLMDYNNSVVFQASLESALDTCRIAIEKEKDKVAAALSTNNGSTQGEAPSVHA